MSSSHFKSCHWVILAQVDDCVTRFGVNRRSLDRGSDVAILGECQVLVVFWRTRILLAGQSLLIC
ncbi:MAG: hypothetical protein QG639_1080 [Patescibacteria group bacterium]|jgi:hypothetical protein|nr:hypothetical protein [Patescibacteria group bacterium]